MLGLLRHQDTYFRTEAEAIHTAKAYLADEDPDCYFAVRAVCGNRYYVVDLFESDGYLIGAI